MQLIDTHAHIYLPEFQEDIEDVLQRAREQGVERIYLPNIDKQSHEALLALAARYPETCFPMMGLHPGSVKDDWKTALDSIEQVLFSAPQEFKAVGEIGLDLYWEQDYLKQQLEAFEKQISWAKDLNLPIVIHIRDAFDEAFELIDKLNDERLRGIFHCFTGTLEQANHIIHYGGFKLGIGGVLTFKNSGLDAVIKDIDMEHLVLETDAPFLAPAPFRGKRNEPAHVALVAKKLAEIKGLDIEEVAGVSSANAFTIFEA